MGLMIPTQTQIGSVQHGPARTSDRDSIDIQMETVDCPLCGSDDFEPEVQTPDYETGLEGTFRVVRCRGCGLGFTNPRPDEASIARFYRPGYAPHEGHAWDDSWRGRLRRRLEHAVLRARSNYPPQPVDGITRVVALVGVAWTRSRRRAAWLPYHGQGKLLDFGCGAARFARIMQEFGWSVQGVDSSAEVASTAENETGIRVHLGSLPHPDLKPNSFDAVTMWSSLEHVHDPRRVVRAARELLRSGGLLVVSVPNLASWSFRVFRVAWYGLDLPRHLVHFTPHTLLELLQDEGFRVQYLRHIGRDGWLRKSARRARQLGLGPRWATACQWKPLALAISRWTEITSQAECMVAVADRG